MLIGKILPFLGCTCVLVSTAVADPLVISNDPPGAFIDGTNGEILNIGDDGVVPFNTTIGNCVFPAGQILIGSNGGVGFAPNSLQILTADNEPIPSNGAFGGGQSILVFWDDFDDKDGDVFVNTVDDRLIIEWHNRRLDANPGTLARFQLQIFAEVRDDGVVAQLLYDEIGQASFGGGESATIGYQDGMAGFGDFQWSFDTGGAVQNGTVLSLIVPDCGTKAVPTANLVGQVLLVLLLVMVGLYGTYRANHNAN